MTSPDTAMVFVIDDDAAVRESIQGLLKSVGLRSESFGTAQEFLTSQRADGPSCLILDIRLPGLNGLDFQRQLADAGVHIPIIFEPIPTYNCALALAALGFPLWPFMEIVK